MAHALLCADLGGYPIGHITARDVLVPLKKMEARAATSPHFSCGLPLVSFFDMPLHRGWWITTQPLASRMPRPERRSSIARRNLIPKRINYRTRSRQQATMNAIKGAAPNCGTSKGWRRELRANSKVPGEDQPKIIHHLTLSRVPRELGWIHQHVQPETIEHTFQGLRDLVCIGMRVGAFGDDTLA